ncbi:hypothetical protein AO370_0900 [Moraxella catarrhalis]|uniref:Uncharacterized protein n=1 Tax=Moraxella catarrhalis TaxID=480 RepID=A0AB36DNU9_MORCA|nr:hypothetical protein AO370_0900 [Moraxella catarrhalis]
MGNLVFGLMTVGFDWLKMLELNIWFGHMIINQAQTKTHNQ